MLLKVAGLKGFYNKSKLDVIDDKNIMLKK
jgi:hypothetical protein